MLFLFLLFAKLLPALTANGKLTITNRQLANESGKAIQLRGMSTHGLQWFPQCYTASAVQAFGRNRERMYCGPQCM